MKYGLTYDRGSELVLEIHLVNMGHPLKMFTDSDTAMEWRQGRAPMASEKENME